MAGLASVDLAVGGREATGIGETPPRSDIGDGDASVGIGPSEVAVGGVKPGPPQVRDRRRVLVLTEGLLQRPRGDPGGAGDLGEPDFRIVVVVDEREGAPQRGGAHPIPALLPVSGGGDGKGFEEVRGHQAGGLAADERTAARGLVAEQAPHVEVELVQGAGVLGRAHSRQRVPHRLVRIVLAESGGEPVQGRAVKARDRDPDTRGPRHVRRKVGIDQDPFAAADGDLVRAHPAGVGTVEDTADDDLPERRYVTEHARMGVLHHRPALVTEVRVAEAEAEAVHPPLQPDLVGGIHAGEELVGLVRMGRGQRHGGGSGGYRHHYPRGASLSVFSCAERLVTAS